MTIHELGQYIKQKREATGYSLDDVAGRIKISSRVLQRIEDGDIDHLPHAVYSRAFIKSYAEVVSADIEKVNKALEVIYPPEPIENTEEDTIKLVQRPLRTPASQTQSVFVFVIVLIMIAAGGWLVYNRFGGDIAGFAKNLFTTNSTTGNAGHNSSQSEGDAAASNDGAFTDGGSSAGDEGVVDLPGIGAGDTGVENRLLDQGSGQTDAPGPGDAPRPAPGASDSGLQISTPVSGITNTQPVPASGSGDGDEAQEGLTFQVETTPEGGSGTSGGAEPLRETVYIGDPGDQVIHIIGHEECWVNAKADGAVIGRKFTVRAGEKYTLPFNKTISLILGNAGGVEVQYGTTVLKPAGKFGERKVLKFPAEG